MRAEQVVSVRVIRVENVNHSLRRAVCMADKRVGRRDADKLPVRRVRRVWVEVTL